MADYGLVKNGVFASLPCIKLHVYTYNEPAIALNKEFVLEIEATHRNHAFREGRLVDSYNMARLRL